ncbi:methionine biosynthesis protein MetW [Pelagibacteraceae bacterium]|jgi:methionine biosynthesis protein MetW|nr:methionine biosynthesis protein MetW [Pelagibacteraceae bacterium]|tara:strand:- start:1203 stop:1796 length:594 start_codon:yes stop_codon:yes gene_type:complete
MKREFEIISELLPNNSRVLDIGCGDGTLINFLSKEKNIDVRGLELDEENVEACISKGLSVIEGDAETELSQFPDKSFDFVILSQTLQAFYNPVTVLEHLLRIGKSSIVSIPNFGYWKVRTSLLFFGRMPETGSLPYKWYDTPNLHMCTIKDFYELCKSRNISMKKIIGINNNRTSLIHNNNIKLKNLFSEVGIFLIS